MAFGKFIFECDEDNIVLAMRAAKKLSQDETNKECLVAFGEDGEIQMFGRKLKRSISVKQVKP